MLNFNNQRFNDRIFFEILDFKRLYWGMTDRYG